jgi:hypothetical protein
MKMYLIFTVLVCSLCLKEFIEKTDFYELASLILTNGTMVKSF